MLGLLEEPLRAGFFGLCLFDELHHAGQRGILGAFGDGKLQAAALVQGACENLASRGFGDRHRFAGEAGLIDVAGALDHHAIHRHMLAGAEKNDVADGEFLDFHEFVPAGALHEGFVGAELQERVDRLLRPLESVALKDIRETEEEQQQRPLERLTDDSRADGGENHEDIDIKHALAQRGNGGTNTLLTTKNVGSGVEEPCRDRIFANRVVGDERGDQKQKAERAGNLLVQRT